MGRIPFAYDKVAGVKCGKRMKAWVKTHIACCIRTQTLLCSSNKFNGLTLLEAVLGVVIHALLDTFGQTVGRDSIQFAILVELFEQLKVSHCLLFIV